MRSACLLSFLSLAALGQPVVERTKIDGVEVVVMRDAARDVEVKIAPGIGNNSYEMTVRGKRVFWSPYKTVGEYAAKPTHLGNPLLWPWANRIDGVAYWANGKKYSFNLDLGNVRPGPRNTPIHGLITYTDRWKVVRAETIPQGAEVTSRLEYWRYPDLLAQFPFPHNIEVTYRLRDGALEVETKIENLGVEPMPLSLGYHPYFQVNDAPRDEWQVRLPAAEKLTLSDRLIPTGEIVPNPYADPQRLEGVALDDVFKGLKRGADGWARFELLGKQERVAVEFGPKYTVAVVYAPKGRGFVCFEPMTGITNAFNAAHDGWYKELQSVPAGGTWKEVFRVVATGF